MENTNTVRVRHSIMELQEMYDSGLNRKPLEDLMRAWKGIKELPPEDPKSFFMLGGYHGEPFRGAGWGNNQYWGGYCNHGNVLFPTWHRAYLYKLEQALQSIVGCEDVMLPYWDETSDDSVKNGIPHALTDETFMLDGVEIPNPLKSFELPQQILDAIQSDNNLYTKPKGYNTVRYPLSGLVGNDKDKAATEAHNAKFPYPSVNTALLNQNIVNWLNGTAEVGGQPIPGLAPGIYQQFVQCLNAPNYTVFSNTTSAQQWNANNTAVMPLEQPHNNIHLAVGGFDVPGQGDLSPIDGANGDMGENNTAGLDPIFFFHHCNVDRMFWVWQKKHNNRLNSRNQLDVISEYPGTNTVDNQGPTPGVAPNTWLDMTSPLAPFKKEDGTTFVSNDCINIETQLGYTYSIGSLDKPDWSSESAVLMAVEAPAKQIRVTGINRAPIKGSFLVSVFATDSNGKKHLIGTEGVLSRWNVQACANCQTHLEVRAAFDLPHSVNEQLEGAQYDVEIRTRDGVLNDDTAMTIFNLSQRMTKKLYNLEIR